MGIKVDRKGKRSISRKTQLAKLIEAEGEVSGKGRKVQITRILVPINVINT